MPALFESGVTWGEKSWHGLETNLPLDHSSRTNIAEALELSGMDWTVAKMPLAIDPEAGAELGGTPAKGVYGIFRTDRWECLGAAGEQYEPLQNREIFARFQPFADSGCLRFESVGSVDGGKRVYVQARLTDDDTDIGGGDRIAPYMLLASSHDGTMATRVGFTPQRVVCINTLAAAISNKASRLLRVRHTSGQTAALDDVMACVDVARMEFAATCDLYRKLLAHPINQTDLCRYVKRVLEIPETAERGEISARTRNQFDAIIQLALYGRGQSAKELTAWSAYNGVTQWITHNSSKDAAVRRKSMLFGANEARNRKALELALTLAS